MFVFQRSIIPPVQVVIVSALLIDKNDLQNHSFPAAYLAFWKFSHWQVWKSEKKEGNNSPQSVSTCAYECPHGCPKANQSCTSFYTPRKASLGKRSDQYIKDQQQKSDMLRNSWWLDDDCWIIENLIHTQASYQRWLWRVHAFSMY